MLYSTFSYFLEYTKHMKWWVVRRRIHSSWLIAAAACGVLIGIMSAQYVEWSYFATPVWMIAGALFLLLGLCRPRLYMVPLVVGAGLLVGLARGGIDQQALQPYVLLIGHQATVVGVVEEDVDKGKNDELTFRLGDITVDGHKLAGTIWISTSSKVSVQRSDTLKVQGTLTDGFGTFSAIMYRAQVVNVWRPQPGDIALRLRDWFASAIKVAIPQPEASLGVGYLVGQRQALPSELDDALRIAGLTHVVVASGYNLTILVRLARRVFVTLSKYLSLVAAGSMIIGFIAITGLNPSMSRAGLVTGLALVAWYYGRKFHPLVLLPFTAAMTVLINPSYAWGDLGWQLSFAAFGGVMVIAPLAQNYFFGNKKPGVIRQIIGETTAAQVATLPIILLNFGQLSNVALLANLLILPLVPLAMLLTFMAGIGALIVPDLSTWFGLPAYWVLHYMTSIIGFIARLPWAASEVTLSIASAMLCYAAIVAVCLYMWRKTKLNLRETSVVE